MKTTIELPEPLLERARSHAAREKTTLRALVEAGLRRVLDEAAKKENFVLPDLSVRGRGVQPEFRGASWEKIRDEIYRGRGS